jgi:hypothetical protein
MRMLLGLDGLGWKGGFRRTLDDRGAMGVEFAAAAGVVQSAAGLNQQRPAMPAKRKTVA